MRIGRSLPHSADSATELIAGNYKGQATCRDLDYRARR